MFYLYKINKNSFDEDNIPFLDENYKYLTLDIYQTKPNHLELDINNLSKIKNEGLEYDLYGYQYRCSSREDLIFCIFHYLVINNYKFSTCKHCENIFATKNLKQEYCNRKSPIENFTHLNCEQAVRNITQNLQRKYRQYRKYMESKVIKDEDVLKNDTIEHSKFNYFNNFINEYGDKMKKFRKIPNELNTLSCFKLLNKNKVYSEFKALDKIMQNKSEELTSLK